MPSYVIVGASRGLGYEWIRNLGQDSNNTVIGLARTPAPVKERLSKDQVSNVHVLEADLASVSSLHAAAKQATTLLPGGALDCLIINGAYLAQPSCHLLSSGLTGQEKLLHDEMHTSLDVNVLGVMHSINAFLPLVLKGTAKNIIVISSGLSDTDTTLDVGVGTAVVYSTIKAATNMIVVKYGIELKEQGVVVLALSPGVVNTAEKPPPPEELAALMEIVDKFRARYPTWTGPLTPEESVNAQRKVIEGLTIADSGKFLSHHGNKQWV